MVNVSWFPDIVDDVDSKEIKSPLLKMFFNLFKNLFKKRERISPMQLERLIGDEPKKIRIRIREYYPEQGLRTDWSYLEKNGKEFVEYLRREHSHRSTIPTERKGSRIEIDYIDYIPMKCKKGDRGKRYRFVEISYRLEAT